MDFMDKQMEKKWRITLHRLHNTNLPGDWTVFFDSEIHASEEKTLV